jgi:hypothetical protein
MVNTPLSLRGLAPPIGPIGAKTLPGAPEGPTLRNHTSAAAFTLQTLAGGTQTNVNAWLLVEKLS